MDKAEEQQYKTENSIAQENFFENENKRVPARAILAGLFIYGGAQIYSGFFERGMTFYVIGLILGCIIIFLEEITGESIAYALIAIIFWIVVLIDGYKCSKKQDVNYELKWFNRWYVYLGLLFVSVFITVVFRAAIIVYVESMLN
jgi:hypothetical protein